MNAKEAKALADQEQPRLKARHARNVALELTTILDKIKQAAGQGGYNCLVDLPYKENTMFLENLGYVTTPAMACMMEISWQN